MRFLIALFALFAPVAAAHAAGNVSLASEVFVEKTKLDAHGKPTVALEPPAVVTPGDKLVFVLSYSNATAQPATGFTLTNPIPASVSFTGAEGEGAVVSVDGGKSWGQLATLKVAAADGTSRAATPADVTHVRWTFGRAIAVGEAGKLRFRGVVK
jgi:uncharacterized repeat protein (TIGR01451 family)